MKIMTVDLEFDWKSQKASNVTEILPRLLDLFDDFDIKATFFTLGSLAEQYESEVREISKKHEVASHGHTHEKPLTKLQFEDVLEKIRQSKSVFDTLGISCRGFRAPWFKRPRTLTDKILQRLGFKYDSSVIGNLKPLQKADFYQIPASYGPWPIPYGLSYLRLFYPFSKMLSGKQSKVFYLHPHEFLASITGAKLPFHERQLLRRNLGRKAWDIFKEFLTREDTEWTSCWGYLQKKNLV